MLGGWFLNTESATIDRGMERVVEREERSEFVRSVAYIHLKHGLRMKHVLGITGWANFL